MDTDRRWTDTTLPVAERVDALLGAMTPEEKVAQLGSVWPGFGVDGTGEVAPMQEVFAAGVRDFAEAVKYGVGHVTRVFGTAPVTAEEGRTRSVELQRQIVDGSRLGVPAIVHEECLTGFTTYSATIYPTSLAWAATFDPELVERMAAAIAADMRAVGVHQGLSPVLDVVRDYRWGRVEETMGEDPYLVGVLGSAYVRGLERTGVVATLKHFAGYSASRAARNHAPVSMGPRELREFILPPFEAAIRAGGARSVMNSYTEIDGVPVGANAGLLTGVLRDDWGFDGVVVSDYWSVAFLRTMHRVAADFPSAGALALQAGIDVELPDALCYDDALAQRVPDEVLDRAVRRVLTMKAELGLLDPDWTPEGAVAAGAGINLDSPGNRAIARQLAEESVTLLANDGDVLPLSGPRRIAVIGPCGDDPQAFFGCYSFPNHGAATRPDLGLGVEAPSLLAALRAEFPDAEITVHPGCPIADEDRSGIADASAAAAGADLVIAAVGDRAGLFGRGTSGEGCDVPDLSLPGVQGELVTALIDAGTPVVLVVVSGRPYALGDHTRAAAVVQAFMPGEEGGAAIAGVLSGRINPSGRLPVQVPRLAGGQPSTYLQPPLGANSEGVSNLDPTPLFPFGHGLSYSTYEYSDMTLSAAELPTDGKLTVSVRVRNTGDRDGTEIVQLYLHDVQAAVTRPLRQLAGFHRVPLAAGASATVTFTLHADRTSFVGPELRRIVEAGDVEIHVGRSAADLPLTATIRLTGDTRELGPDRVLFTESRLTR
ncbi:MAG TPA: glycoside hydrolase family 3 N-terminal domain-containing protein [Actinoplanes sp.]|nr:glycoside hydrolase family 3 N-terminal domain-containing protein [Actinoplanes sp.]